MKKTSPLFLFLGGLAGAWLVFGTTRQLARPAPDHAAAPAAEPSVSTVAQVSPVPATAASSSQAPKLDNALATALSAAQREVRALTARDSLLAANEGALFFANNPAQRLVSRFGPGSISFECGSVRGAMKRKGGSGKITASGSRVEYRSAEGTEWFDNREDGLEHGMVLAERPARGRLEFVLEGLKAQTDPEHREDLLLQDESGTPCYAYRSIIARDAAGTPVPATLESTADGFAWVLNDAAASYPVTVDPLLTPLATRLERANGGFGEQFGYSVDLEDDYAVVGAGVETTTAGERSGAVYTFKRTSGVWAQESRLTGNAAAAGDAFGLTVRLSGNTLAVCAALDDEPMADVGSVQIFIRSGTQWVFQAQIVPPEPINYGQFGSVMALDGNHLVVGQVYASPQSVFRAGAAYAYERTGTLWNYQGVLTAPLTQEDYAGSSVDVKGDTLVVGAPGRDRNGLDGCGVVYLYRYFNNGWAFLREISPSDAAAHDQFGARVALDSDKLVVGAQNKTRDGKTAAGQVYVFTGTSMEQQAILDFPAQENALDPWNVAVAGRYIVIGSPLTSRVRVMEQIGSTWIERALIASPDLVGNNAVDFADSIALSGSTMIVGGPFAPAAGRSYIFELGSATKETSVFVGPEPGLRETESGQTLTLAESYLDETRNIPLFVLNDGRTNLRLSSWQLLSGSDQGFFLQSPPFAAYTLAPTDSRSFQLSGNFTTTGIKKATVRVFTDDADEPSFDIPLTFRVIPRPALPGLKIKRTGTQVTLTYPKYANSDFYQVESSEDLQTWTLAGAMYQAFDPETSLIVMKYDEQAAGRSKAFYRVVVNGS